MRSFLETIKNLFVSENKEVGIEGALRGYDPMQKAHIVNLYNCYGIDAVIKYLNSVAINYDGTVYAGNGWYLSSYYSSIGVCLC